MLSILCSQGERSKEKGAILRIFWGLLNFIHLRIFFLAWIPRFFLFFWGAGLSAIFFLLFLQKSTNINEAYHGLFHKRYAVGGKGNLAPKSSITQNKFACCSISTSHSRALLDVLLLGGLSPTSPIAISMEKKGEEELERKEKRREKSKTIEGRRKRKEMRERKKVKKGEKDYQSQIELQKGGEEANDKKRKREGEGEGKGKEREEEEGRLTKKRLTLTKNKCGLCHELGHNKRTCPKK